LFGGELFQAGEFRLVILAGRQWKFLPRGADGYLIRLHIRWFPFQTFVNEYVSEGVLQCKAILCIQVAAAASCPDHHYSAN
jgi:hypothetical protein